MKYYFEIGTCIFELSADCNIPINPKEQCFMTNKQPADYQIFFTSIPTPIFDKEQLLYLNENVIITRNSENLIKRYHRLIHLNMIYGMSILRENMICVNYYSDSLYIQNPSFSIWNFFHLEQVFIRHQGFILHASYIADSGKAILFSAPSGTGKSTQSDLWKKVRGSQIINGDRCLLLKTGTNWTANGFPFHGTSEYCENKSFPLGAIIILRQGKTNEIVQLSDNQKIKLLLSETIYNSWDSTFITKVINLITNLVQTIPVYEYHCTMEYDAVTELEKYIRR